MIRKSFDYEGYLVSFEKDEGKGSMINATEMAKPFGKRPNDWLSLPSTVEFLDVLTTTRKSGSCDYQAVTTKNCSPEYGGGTWMHEDAALEFARWLSPHFAIWCNDRIKELLTTGQTALPQDYLSALKALVASEEEKQRLALENKVMKPKADYFDDLVDRNLLTSLRDTAKLFNMPQKTFIDWLLAGGYLYRDGNKRLKPYSGAVSNGLFQIKEFKASNSEHAGVQTLITPKGRETFRLLVTRR